MTDDIEERIESWRKVWAKDEITGKELIDIFDIVKELSTRVREQEDDGLKEPFNLHIYSYMITIHGNTRDFEEELCDDLAEMILEDFDIRWKHTPPKPIQEHKELTGTQQVQLDCTYEPIKEKPK